MNFFKLIISLSLTLILITENYSLKMKCNKDECWLLAENHQQDGSNWSPLTQLRVVESKCDNTNCDTLWILDSNNHCYICQINTCARLFDNINDPLLSKSICNKFNGNFSRKLKYKTINDDIILI
jgi:hypothetical protein